MQPTQASRVRGKNRPMAQRPAPAPEQAPPDPEARIVSEPKPEVRSAHCRVLFVTDGNLLDDGVSCSGEHELIAALVQLGLACDSIGRFVVAADEETDAEPWLAQRGWQMTVAPAETPAVLRGKHNGVAMTLLRGGSTKPHPADEAERAALVRVVHEACDRQRPDVLVVHAGPSMADVLAVGRGRGIATVALQPDCTPRDPGQFRDADLVLTPTRLATEYLREAFGLPCVNLPPVVAREAEPATLPTPGLVVFDGEAAGHGMFVFAQIAEELSKRRPDIPVVLLGGTGTYQFPGGGQVRCLPNRAPDFRWSDARVLLAPILDWDALPLTALAALASGVPVLSSNRGAMPEVLDGSATILPLPDRMTAALPVPLKPEELAPWIDTIQRLYDDPTFAAGQRSLALLAGKRWTADEVAPQYARCFTNLARTRHTRLDVSRNGTAKDDAAAGLRRLAQRQPWPAQRPADAAPGQEQGWLGEGTEVVLARSLSPATQLVVELGAWLGLSTRYIASLAPSATVISVDTWEGSPEHKTQERYRELLPRLFETFQSRCWEQRDRIVPLRMTSLDGLRAVAEAGLQPDMVYIDAEHSYAAVTAELTLARQLFPRARLVGDDYDWLGVREAADTFARRHALIVERFGARGWRLLESWEAGTANFPPPGRRQCHVLVPHMNGIEWECEQALRALEGAGVRVVRRGGCSAIDVARNELVSDALHNEAESILFIDSDIGFDPHDALRLLARPEPVLSGVYAKKGMRELASIFADGTKQVLFGPDAVGPYPLKYAATGFLRLRAGVLRRMIAELKLPLCNTHWGRGIWPFFQPMIVPHGPGKLHYLGEDWSFSYRLAQIGVTPLADTSIRLWHWGRYSYSWEDAGSTVQRYRSYNYGLQ